MKKLTHLLLGILLFTVAGCRLAGPDQAVDPIIEPPTSVLVGRDTISDGKYLGVGINEDAKSTYAAVQSLLQSHGVAYMNIVSNVFSDVSQLRTRIPLYSYILLDQKEGTDSGIQITLEAGKVKSIYLNNGEKLSQWPGKENAKSSIRLGDEAGRLYEKLVRIRQKSRYAGKFERIMLATKDLATSFDPGMAQSPQWYFAYTTAADLLEVVNINFKNERVTSIEIKRYKK